MFANRFSLLDVEYNEIASALHLQNKLPVHLYEQVERAAELLVAVEKRLGHRVSLISWYTGPDVIRELSRDAYLQHCIANQHRINAESYEAYVDSVPQRNGTCVKLRRFDGDVQKLEDMTVPLMDQGLLYIKVLNDCIVLEVKYED